MFLFAVGYGVGPQFVRGIAKDGIRRRCSPSWCACLSCGAYLAAKIAGYDVGSAAGLFAGSQTISASMGLATDAINRLGLPADETKSCSTPCRPPTRSPTFSARSARPSSSRRSGRSCLASTWSPHARNMKRRSAAEGIWAARAWPGTSSNCAPIGSGRRAGRRQDGGAGRGEGPDQRGFSSSGSGAAARSRMPKVDAVIQAGDIVAVAGGASNWSNLLGPRGGSRRSGTAGGAGGRRRCLCDEQGGRRQNAGGTRELPGARGVFLRKIKRGPTETDIPCCRARIASRRHRHARRPHRRTSRPPTKSFGVSTGATDVADVAFIGARSRSARWSARWSSRSAASRSRSRRPAAR